MRAIAIKGKGVFDGRATHLTAAIADAFRIRDFGWPFWGSVLVMPFSSNSELALLALLATQLACVLRCQISPHEKCLVCFLLSFAYSGITILDVRLYDWVVLVALVYYIFAQRASFRVSAVIKGFAGLCIVLTLLVMNYSSVAAIQAARFTLSIAACVLFASIGVSKAEISRCVMVPVIVSLYCAIVMLARYGSAVHIDGTIVATNYYIYDYEVRAAGLFSDPNKFMTFLLFMLFLVDWVKGIRGVHIEFIPIIAGLFLTGSRTAIISMALYCVCKFFFMLVKSGLQAIILLCAAISLVLFGALLITSGDLSGFVDAVWNGAAEFFGRDRTLAINQSLSQDNRVLIWQYAWELISDRPFLGWGLDAYQTLLPYPTHNTFLNLMLSGGILYLTAFILNTYPIVMGGRLFLAIALILVPVFLLDLLDYRLLFCIVGLLQCAEIYLDDSDTLLPRESMR